MCFNVHRLSYKTYTNWECGSLGDLTFHLSYGLILLQILKTKAKTKNALVNKVSSKQPVILIDGQDWHPVLIQLSAQNGMVGMHDQAT